MSERVTLQTIADHLGVSRTTVSNAYNRPDELGDELRERILSVAAELGYRGPDAAARMLRTGRMGAIGLLFTEDLRFVFNDPDTFGFIRGVTETSALAGTGITLLPCPPGVDVATTAVGSVAVDGHIVFSVADGHPSLAEVLSRRLPLVTVDEPDLGATSSFVGIDDHLGARLAATHLVELGHRRFAVMLGRLSNDPRTGRVTAEREAASSIRIAHERLRGYRDALAEAGIDPADLVVWESGGNDPDNSRVATADLLRAEPETTAMLCFSDQLAIGACQGGALVGRSVPEELSVVGFDDVPRAETWDPPLTTIRQPIITKGSVAAELLLEQIAGAPTRRTILPIELIVRSSTAPPRPG